MDRTRMTIGAVVLAAAVTLTGVDAAIDRDGFSAPDLLLDLVDRLLLLGAMVVIALMVRRLDRVEREADDLRETLGRAEAAGREWRSRSRRLLDGLSRAVSHQFAAWGLTPAEAEIAALLLKGLPTRDVARLRGTSEATVRQQAQGIYRKSGLANRAELSAYFLEDLFTVAEGAAGVQ